MNPTKEILWEGTLIQQEIGRLTTELLALAERLAETPTAEDWEHHQRLAGRIKELTSKIQAWKQRASPALQTPEK